MNGVGGGYIVIIIIIYGLECIKPQNAHSSAKPTNQ